MKNKFNLIKAAILVMSQDLLWAVKNGDLDAVRQQIEKQVCDRAQICYFLILTVKSIDINGELSGGRCALHYAADMGQRDVAQYLVEKGADVNVCVCLCLFVFFLA